MSVRRVSRTGRNANRKLKITKKRRNTICGRGDSRLVLSMEVVMSTRAKILRVLKDDRIETIYMFVGGMN